MTAYEARILRRKTFAVKVGVYVAIVAGVISQNLISRFDPELLVLDIDITGLTAARVAVALVCATAIYWRLDGKGGELSGKIKNIGRILMLGFTSGFTLMGLAGIGS
jgi:hypothetical protein